MAKKPDLPTSSTLFPREPILKIATGAPALDAEEWTALSTDVYQTIRASIDARATLEANLRTWLALVESDIDNQDAENGRWEDCANLLVPIVPSQLNAMVSYLALQVFTNRFIIVTGNTPEAAKTAPQVERYFNAELMRQRGETTWYNDLLTTLQLGLRDGTCVLESVWERKVSKRLTPVFDQEFETNPETGEETPKFDGDGNPVTKRRMVEQTVVEYDDVKTTPKQLKDFGLIPATAKSVESAVGAWTTEWLMESDLRAMCKDAENNESFHFSWEDCEKALSYVSSGDDEHSGDPQGSYNKTAGSQIEVGLAQGSLTSTFFKNRGPIKVYRLHTRQFDLNHDDVVEENVIWLHEASMRMLGWCPYEYVVPERPFHVWCPFPRPGQAFGYSLVEWLAPLAAEISAIHNQRRDAIDLHISPPFIEKPSADLQNKDMSWGPNAKWLSEDPDAIKVLQMPPMPPDAMQEEMNLLMYVGQITGQDSPALGTQSSGRRSATETRQRQAAESTRSGLAAMRFRHFCRRWINFVWRLKLQYLEDNPSFQDGDQKYTVPREVLARDYRIDISGASDPVDAGARRQETMALFGLLSKIPNVIGKPTRLHRLLQMLCDSFDIVDADSIIGSEQDAQQEEQAAQQQAQMAQAGGAQPARAPGGGPPKPGGAPAPAAGAKAPGDLGALVGA